MLLGSGVTTTPKMKASCISVERGMVSLLLSCGRQIEQVSLRTLQKTKRVFIFPFSR
jgi:hypothetical protein